MPSIVTPTCPARTNGTDTVTETPSRAMAPYTVPVDRTQVIYTENALPAARGFVPTVISAMDLEAKQNKCTVFYDSLIAPNLLLSKLNKESKMFVALVNVPKTSLLKVVYCGGVGSSPIGNFSPIDVNLLFL